VFCDKTIVPEGLTGPQLSFNFTIRELFLGAILITIFVSTLFKKITD
jgi:hypothetical protein